MARRKHYKKAAHHRKHRRKSIHGMGSILTDSLMTIGGGVLGQIASNFATSQLASSTMTAKSKSYISALVPVGVGLLLPKVVKSSVGKNIGTGMIVVGGVKLLQSTGVIAGIISPVRAVALGPSFQNPRGVVAGLSTRKAAIMTA
jgi:hypothetical protein